jgi:hypothetical protein
MVLIKVLAQCAAVERTLAQQHPKCPLLLLQVIQTLISSGLLQPPFASPPPSLRTALLPLVRGMKTDSMRYVWCFRSRT